MLWNITIEEDQCLSKISRSNADGKFKTPEERFAAAGIIFPS